MALFRYRRVSSRGNARGRRCSNRDYRIHSAYHALHAHSTCSWLGSRRSSISSQDIDFLRRSKDAWRYYRALPPIGPDSPPVFMYKSDFSQGELWQILGTARPVASVATTGHRFKFCLEVIGIFDIAGDVKIKSIRVAWFPRGTILVFRLLHARKIVPILILTI